MSKPLLKKFYFMSPVQVVKVTTHNLQQVADWCGGEIKQVESRRQPGRMDSYVDVPISKTGGKNALSWAFPAMFITKRLVVTLENEIKVTYAVFRNDFFSKNYYQEPLDAVDAHWTRLDNESVKSEVIKEINQTTTVMNIHVANPGDVGKALEEARKRLLKNGSKAVEITVFDHINGTTTDITETEDQLPDLSPAQQRMLITEDMIEGETAPETAHVVLPEDATHPSLRSTPEQQNALTHELHRGVIMPTPERQREINAAAHARLEEIKAGDPHR